MYIACEYLVQQQQYSYLVPATVPGTVAGTRYEYCCCCTRYSQAMYIPLVLVLVVGCGPVYLVLAKRALLAVPGIIITGSSNTTVCTRSVAVIIVASLIVPHFAKLIAATTTQNEPSPAKLYPRTCFAKLDTIVITTQINPTQPFSTLSPTMKLVELSISNHTAVDVIIHKQHHITNGT